ncbi:MAG: hypothetical protein LBU28_04390, partial [Spirochaetaceae bacterium]|nr:hypothetical protein [Spirochaetaceae bacterium]
VYGGEFTLSGGEVSGNTAANLPGNNGVSVSSGTFIMSGDARPEGVFLRCYDRITIGGPLSGGMTVIDLEINITASLSNWVGKRILSPDGARKARFKLGNAVSTNTSTPTPITGYTIDESGYFIAEP